MGFDQILGQGPAIETLTRALRSGRVHHAYRFEGPPGVGKEMTALALAQALVCEASTPLACEKCSACRRAMTLSSETPEVPLHPDVVLVGRGVYPPSILGAGVTEATGISVEQIRRVVLERSGFPPHEGRALCFIVRDAEELTLQAANALLKTLEEPSERTHFVLLSSRPNRLLDTVRSRTLAVRFGALPDEVVATLLERRGLPTSAVALAQGSADLAILLADENRMQERDAFVRAAQAALDAPDLAEAIALGQSRAETRDGLRAQLGFFAQSLATRSASEIESRPDRAERDARRYSVVLGAIAEVERNVSPALALEAMVTRLRRI